jgi:uncharacterized protein with PIN domain
MSFPLKDAAGQDASESAVPTPWAVRCWDCGQGEESALVFLTREEYARQLARPHAFWHCPRCGREAIQCLP